MKMLRWILLALTATAATACVDPHEEKGICSYLGTCELGLETYMDMNYCKELGSCDDGTDPTEYTASGKPSKASGGGVTNTDSSSSSGASGASSSSNDDSQ